MIPVFLYTVLPTIFSNWLLLSHLEKVHAYYGKTWFAMDGHNLRVHPHRKLLWITIYNVTGLFLAALGPLDSTMAATLILTAVSLAISEMDLSFGIIPDRYQLLGFFTATGELMVLYHTETPLPWKHLIFNVMFWSALFLSAGLYHKFRSREGIGMGDIKLLFWMIFAVPLHFVPAILIGILSALSGQFAKGFFTKKTDHSTPFPLGPYLVLGMMASRIHNILP